MPGDITPPSARANGQPPLNPPSQTASAAGQAPSALAATQQLTAGGGASAPSMPKAEDIFKEQEARLEAAQGRIEAVARRRAQKAAHHNMASTIESSGNKLRLTEAGKALVTTFCTEAQGVIKGLFGEKGAETLCDFFKNLAKLINTLSPLIEAKINATVKEAIDTNKYLSPEEKAQANKVWGDFVKSELKPATQQAAPKPKSPDEIDKANRKTAQHNAEIAAGGKVTDATSIAAPTPTPDNRQRDHRNAEIAGH